MKLAIITKYSIPFGMAATNRIMAYARGLIASGVDVTIIVTEPSDDCGSNNLGNDGEYSGVKYHFSSGRFKSKSKILRAISILSGYRFWAGVFNTANFLRNKHFDAVIISNDTPKFLNYYSHLSKKNGAKTIFIFDEYPTPIRHKLKTDIPNSKKEAYKKILVEIDGFISISEQLKSYYTSFVKKPTHVLAIIVDTERFYPMYSELELEEEICYMGNMELSKDNVDNIIKAFGLISEKYPEYKLKLYGSPNLNDKDLLNNLKVELGLVDRVFLMGRVSASCVPSILAKAKILVSSQPNTLRAAGGFPTKLGEYLATQTPTLLCDVGENAKYIKNREHCFFAKPDDPKDFAEQLEYIIDNYSDALELAKQGRKLVVENYSHIAAGKKIKEFIQTLQ